jgi:hypothetical protein
MESSDPTEECYIIDNVPNAEVAQVLSMRQDIFDLIEEYRQNNYFGCPKGTQAIITPHKLTIRAVSYDWLAKKYYVVRKDTLPLAESELQVIRSSNIPITHYKPAPNIHAMNAELRNLRSTVALMREEVTELRATCATLLNTMNDIILRL